MAIGQRIKFFRNRKGLTQKQLGEMLGFMGKTSDVRMAQYESEARTPKQDLVREMSDIFGVNTQALTVPNIDSYIGLMHTLFALEDMYGLEIKEIDGVPYIHLEHTDSNSLSYESVNRMLYAWQQQAALLRAGQISKDTYDEWRYNYPDLDTSVHWAKLPSEELNDMLMEEYEKIQKQEKKTNKKKNKK